MTRAPSWLEGRPTEPPAPLRAWIEANGPTGSWGVPELADAALRAFGRVRESPGRNREAAFDLLGADALLTYACEEALEGGDPEESLRRLVQRVASEP